MIGTAAPRQLEFARTVLHRSLALATGLYAVMLVTATHWPRITPPQVWSPFLPPDKMLHLLAYGFLAALATATAALAQPSRRPAATALFVMLVLFAALDEVTQPIFGRAAEPFDLVADVAGGLLGFAAVRLLVRVLGTCCGTSHDPPTR